MRTDMPSSNKKADKTLIFLTIKINGLSECSKTHLNDCLWEIDADITSFTETKKKLASIGSGKEEHTIRSSNRQHKQVEL